MRELIARCLRKDPRRRLQAIGDARIALEDWVADPASMAGPEVPAAAAPAQSQTWKWLVPLILVAGLVVATGMALFSRQPPARLTQSFLLAPVDGQIRAEQGLALSSDGSNLAFARFRSGSAPWTASPRGRSKELQTQAFHSGRPTAVIWRSLPTAS
jgi:hypothetical protein